MRNRIYHCSCGAPWMTIECANRVIVAEDPNAWRVCPRCDGEAAATVMMPAHLRGERGAVNE